MGEIAAQSMITGEKGEGEREDVEEGADRGCGGQLQPISLLLCFIRCCDAMTHPMGGRSANKLHSAVSMEFMQPFENDGKFNAVCWVPNHPPRLLSLSLLSRLDRRSLESPYQRRSGKRFRQIECGEGERERASALEIGTGD